MKLIEKALREKGDVSELSDEDLRLLEAHILRNEPHSGSDDLFMKVVDELTYRESEMIDV